VDEVRPRFTGCFEICQLASGNSYDQELLREAGAIEAVIQALMSFPESVKVQIEGVQAVLHLAAANDQCRARLGAAGAAQAVVTALHRFSQEQVTPRCTGDGKWSGCTWLT
jgi:hypothetical protein